MAPVPREPAPAPVAVQQEEPVLAEPAPAEPAATDVAGDGLIPAAEVWDESVAAEATEVTALQGSQAEDAQTPLASAEDEALAAPEPTAPAEPAPVAELAAPSEPVVATAEASDQGSTIAAPLDFSVVATGGTSSAPAEEAAASEEARPSASADSADTISVATISDTPAAPAAPEQTASAPAASEPELPVEAAHVPKVYGRTNLDARVVITAVDDSWVQVQGPDNELLLTRILHPGDTYRVPDRPGLFMVTGNAGGLEIQVDNAPAPSLGPLGVVMRNIALDPDRLLAGTATGG